MSSTSPMIPRMRKMARSDSKFVRTAEPLSGDVRAPRTIPNANTRSANKKKDSYEHKFLLPVN